MFAKLMELNCPYFNFNGCVFSKENMLQRDSKDQSQSKKGAVRVAMHKALGIPHW
jgi:hypothetical protein